MEIKRKIHFSIILVSLSIYLAIWLLSPTHAEKSASTSLTEIKRLFIPILAAVFVGSVAKNVLSGSRLTKSLGGETRFRGLFLGGSFGSLLPPCPYVSYPLIKGINDGGANYPSTMAMLLGLTTVATGRMFAGIAILGPEIEGLRIVFSFAAMVSVSALYFFIMRRWAGAKIGDIKPDLTRLRKIG